MKLKTDMQQINKVLIMLKQLEEKLNEKDQIMRDKYEKLNRELESKLSSNKGVSRKKFKKVGKGKDKEFSRSPREITEASKAR